MIDENKCMCAKQRFAERLLFVVEDFHHNIGQAYNLSKFLFQTKRGEKMRKR